MVTKRKPTKRTKKNAGARQSGHPVSAPASAPDGAAPGPEAAEAAASAAAPGGRPAAAAAVVPAAPAASAPKRPHSSGCVPASASGPLAAASPAAAAAVAGDAAPSTVAAAASERPARLRPLSVADDPFDGDSPFDGDGDGADDADGAAARGPLRDGAPHAVAADAGGIDDADDADGRRASDAHDRDSANKRPTAAKKQHSLGFRVALSVSAAALIALIAVGGLFSWNRWFCYDDAADFIGEWQIHGTEATIVIDGERINLAADAAYSYTLDTKAKTVRFTLGTMEGGGRYRFACDRTQLVIEDGEFGSWLSNAWHDLPWVVNELLHRFLNADLNDPSGENMSVLDRAGAASADHAAEADGADGSGSADADAVPDAAADGADAASADGADGASDGSEAASPVEGGSAAGEADGDDPDGGASQGDAPEGGVGSNALTVEDLTGASQ